MKNHIKNITALMLLFSLFTYGQVSTKSGTVNRGTPTVEHELLVNSRSTNYSLFAGQSPGLLFSEFMTKELRLPAIGLSTKANDYISSSKPGDFNIRSGEGKDIHIGTLISTSAVDFGIPRMTIKNNGNIGIGTTFPSYKLQVQGDILTNNGWFRATGSKGLYFQSYGGGLVMTDPTWIRTYGNKSFYHNTGIMRTDGELQVGPNGERLIVNQNGNVGIGTGANTSNYKLAVKGNIIAEELKIRTYTNWPDYVFESDYDLMSLKDIENHIKEKGHLPNIPSAKSVVEQGINVGEMSSKLLEKIEELTLYLIAQEKDIKSLKEQNISLRLSIEEFTKIADIDSNK